MKALTWQGKRSVSVEEVPDPRVQEPTDAIVRITSTAICGSDLHLYEVLTPFMDKGDIIGHEPFAVILPDVIVDSQPGALKQLADNAARMNQK